MGGGVNFFHFMIGLVIYSKRTVHLEKGPELQLIQLRS